MGWLVAMASHVSHLDFNMYPPFLFFLVHFSPGPGERSYHIFYFLLRGATPAQKAAMHLKGIDDYNYLSASGCDTVPNMDDVEEFHDVVDALRTVGVSDSEMVREVRTLNFVCRRPVGCTCNFQHQKIGLDLSVDLIQACLLFMFILFLNAMTTTINTIHVLF